MVVVVYTLVQLQDTAFAQELNDTGKIAFIEATTSVDRNEVTIGDKIKFKIRVKYKDDITVQFPEFSHQLGAFTVKGTEPIAGPKREKDGYFIVERHYVLSSYEIGRTTIPSVEIKYKSVQGEGKVITNEVAVDIKGILKEGETAADIKDILPPVDVPTNYKRLIRWVFVGLGALLLAGITYGLINKLKMRPNKPEQELIKKAPHEVAYELLERLSREELVAKGLVKEYYYRITDILRHYIEDRFGLLAPEQTTEEFLVEMAHTNKLEENHKLLIREFLEHCDMVKYAKYGPSRAEIKETYDLAKRLIDETIECLEEKEVSVG
ncbi:MAG TPA: hypothetical protein ACFYEC_01950 [Candidatus Brocadiaceae bacterium]